MKNNAGTEIIICATCGKVFKSFKSSKSKYCSKKCYYTSGAKRGARNRLIKNCTYCGKPVERPASNFKKGMNPYCDQICMAKHFAKIDRYRGENNHNWRGGYSQLAYRRGWDRLKKEVKKRAGGVCEICHKTHKLMDVHHKIPVCSNEDISIINDIKNLQYLCRPCHILADKILRGYYPNGKPH